MRRVWLGTVLGPVITDPIQWQDTSLLDLNKADIATLEVTRDGQPAVALAQDKEKGWPSATLSGRPGAFLLPAPAAGAFEAPMLEGAKPAGDAPLPDGGPGAQ